VSKIITIKKEIKMKKEEIIKKVKTEHAIGRGINIGRICCLFIGVFLVWTTLFFNTIKLPLTVGVILAVLEAGFVFISMVLFLAYKQEIVLYFDRKYQPTENEIQEYIKSCISKEKEKLLILKKEKEDIVQKIAELQAFLEAK
jgi:hypothetical protein